MKGVIPETTRLRDRHDQADLVERIAGQAARDVALPTPLSRTALARIATQIDERRDRRHRLPPLSWALVVGAFLLGIVTAASAAHMDLLPSWLARIVSGAAMRSSHQTPPPANGRRSAVPKQAPGPSAPSAPAKKMEAPSALQEVPGSASASGEQVRPLRDPALESTRQQANPTPNHPSSEPSPRKPRRMAMLKGRAVVPSISATPRPVLLPAASASWEAAGHPAAERPSPVVPWPWPWPSASPPAEQGP